MQNQDNYSAGVPQNSRGRYNRRRVVMLVVVIFVVVLSFLAGRATNKSRMYIQPTNTGAAQQSGSDRAGVPPDSMYTR